MSGRIDGAGNPGPDWHARAFAEVARELRTHLETGLAIEDLPLPSRTTVSGASASRRIWRILWTQLKGGVILVLLVASVASLLLGHTGDALAIIASVVFSVAFGFATDWRAERALDALRTLSAPTARVVRGGLEREVRTDDVRCGDLLILSAGQIVAADGRLAAVRDLQIDESALTGESVPVTKALEPIASTAPLPERTNMAYAGTTVLSGWGRMIVTEAPGETELSRIGELVAGQQREPTPLERQAEQLGRRLAVVVIALSSVVTLLGILRSRSVWIMLETGGILAIAAIPEGLPAVTTIALAVGVRRMARAHSLVRRLASVETLGCTSVICTDKTGTLTENTMRVTRIWLAERELEVTGSGYSPDGEFLEDGRPVAAESDPTLRRLLEIAALCNDARLESHDGWHIHGSSTEGALLALAGKGGGDPTTRSARFERLHEIAFTSGRKRMAVVVREAGGGLWMFVKGSPEALLALSSRVLDSGGERPLDPEERARLLARARTLGETGHRVLAFAFRGLESPREPEAAEENLTWVGLAGLVDPPRAGVREAIAQLRGAGIRTVMVTGDQKATAMAVARELEIAGAGDLCVDSGELAELVRERRWEDVRQTAVFARVSPEDKLSIIRALKAAGHVVAMTGDGINDAPALKAADIGIAIGRRAADVARESSDLVVTSGDYGTLPTAVAEGRRIYANIRRSVHFLLLCSLSTIGVMLASVVANLPLPMSPLQVLWLNLVVHIFPAIALVVIPGEADLLCRPPRDPHEPLLTWRATGVIALRSCVVAAAVLWIFTTGGNREDGVRSQTLAMATLALALLAQTFAGLSEHRPFWTMKGSLTPPFWLALSGGLALQALAVLWSPLASVLPTARLSPSDWLHVLGMSVLALAIVELGKALAPDQRPIVPPS
jgi:Ca2+-transporting ATPase